MRSPGWLSLLLVFMVVLAEKGWAHGHGYRGPRVGPPPAGIPCDCARTDCTLCSTSELRRGERLDLRDVREEVVRRWDDVAEIRVTARFRSKGGPGPLEAATVIAPLPLFAAVSAEMAVDGRCVAAALAPSQDTRRRFLWARTTKRCGLLLTRRAFGRYDLRVFPVGDSETRVVLTGYRLVAPGRTEEPRPYRTGDRVLLICERRPGRPAGEGEYVDSRHGRLLAFLPVEQARSRFGPLVDRAEEVPFVEALRSAALGTGHEATNRETVLAALERDAPLPPLIGAEYTAAYRKWANSGVPTPPDPVPPPPEPPAPAKKDG